MLTKGGREGKGQIMSLGLADANYHIYKIDNQEGPTV